MSGPRGGGLSYGWSAANVETRDQSSGLSLDQRYDTLIHTQRLSNPAGIKWEIAAPNGSYKVRIVAGGPS